MNKGICNFDPFGLGHSTYRMSTVCINHPELVYNEGAYKIVSNAKETVKTGFKV